MTAAADLDTDFELMHVHPRDLIIGPNVRRDPQYADLVASIREVGVLSPISAFWNSEGSLVVVLGQRRTLAADEAERDTVPVYVITQPDDVNRLVDQYVENAHRADLTVADTVETWHQLEGFGLDAEAIAQRTTTSLERVQQGLKVASTPAALGTVRQRPDVTFDQAFALAEFANDKDATGRLVRALDAGRGFDHEAQRLRDDRAEAQAKDALEHELAEAGVKLFDTLPYGVDGKAAQLSELKDGKRNCTAANHASCKGHAAYVRRRWGTDGYVFEAVYLCRDWRKHEHTARNGSAGTRSSGSTGTSTPEESAERKRVIAGNKAWRSATTVRRAWLADFVHRKNVNEHQVERFIADVILAGEHVLTNAMSDGHGFYFRLVAGETPEQLGKAQQVEVVEVGSPRARRRELLADEINTATRPAALAITAGLILAAWERHANDPQAWRNPGGGTYYSTLHGRYLAAMAAWGYELAPIEQALVDGETWQPDPA